MISVITGDIIRSRVIKDQGIWLEQLKSALNNLSSDSKNYEIYRGDSFQLELSNYQNAFKAAMYIKACLKMIKGVDVRMAIGIGTKSYIGKTVSESNGEAFVLSGEAFETLKKDKINLKLKTRHSDVNKELNLYFKFALIAMDHWTINSAEIVKLSIEHPNLIQRKLAKLIGISQDAVSKRQKRAHLEELMELDIMFRQKTAIIKYQN